MIGALVSHDLAAQSLNEVALRPLSGTCPRCGTSRGWARSVCPTCSRGVRREWLVLLAGALGMIGIDRVIGEQWVLIAYGGFVILTLALAITDIDAMRIVNQLNIPGTAILAALLVVTSALDGDIADVWRALLGAAVYFALTNLMFFAARGRAFGYGDVKLSVQLGLFTAYLSWITLVWAVFLMALLGGVVALIVIVFGIFSHSDERSQSEGSGVKQAMRREVPYGPAMIGGSWLAIYLVGIGLLGS